MKNIIITIIGSVFAFILASIIENLIASKGVSGANITVFVAPLIEELLKRILSRNRMVSGISFSIIESVIMFPDCLISHIFIGTVMHTSSCKQRFIIGLILHIAYNYCVVTNQPVVFTILITSLPIIIYIIKHK